jgi:hypothetical protein
VLPPQQRRLTEHITDYHAGLSSCLETPSIQAENNKPDIRRAASLGYWEMGSVGGGLDEKSQERIGLHGRENHGRENHGLEKSQARASEIRWLEPLVRVTIDQPSRVLVEGSGCHTRSRDDAVFEAAGNGPEPRILLSPHLFGGGDLVASCRSGDYAVRRSVEISASQCTTT